MSRVRWRSTSTPTTLVGASPGRDRPRRLRRRHAARSPRRAGRRGRGRPRPVRARSVHRAGTAARAPAGPPAVRGLRAPASRGARGRARAADHRRRAPTFGHHASREPARRRLAVPLDAVVGGRGADAGARRRPRTATGSTRATSVATPTWELTNETAPLTALMHDRPPWSIEEDCELVDLDLCSYTLEWHARVPSWRDHYLGLDQRRHYAFLRKELQVLSYLRGPNRWVLKTPQHLEQLGPLLDTFPDATIAFTLRDPVAVLQSAITMLAYGDRMRRVRIDADELAAYWIDRVERLLRAACARCPPDPRSASGSTSSSASSWPTTSRWRPGSWTSPGSSSPTRRAARSRRTWPATPEARRAAWSTTFANDFGVDPADAARAVRVLLRGVPADPQGGVLMSGIHRERPGADAIAAVDGHSGGRPRRRHLDVAGSVEQLPARHR